MLPVIINAHQGGAIAGTMENSAPDAAHNAYRLGVVVVDVDYRLAPEANYQQMIGDFYVAARYTYENAQALNVA